MGLSTFITDLIDTGNVLFSKATKRTLDQYCQIETADDDRSLAMADGSLISVMQLHGSRSVVGVEERHAMAASLTERLSPFLSKRGHAFQFYFAFDPDLGRKIIHDALEDARIAARQTGLDIADILTERERVLSSHLHAEQCFLVLWTRPSILDKAEFKEVRKEQAAERRRAPRMRDAQYVDAVASQIRMQHSSMVLAVAQAFEGVEVAVEVLEAHRVLSEIRSTIYPDHRNPDWKPVLPGDRIPVRFPRNQEAADHSHVLWPTVGHQIFEADAETIDRRTCRIGDKLFASVDMTLAPEHVKSFQVLIDNMAERGLPWRISFLVEGAGMDKISWVTSAAVSILKWSLADPSGNNRRLGSALDELKALNLAGDTIVGLRVSLATWADKYDPRLISERHRYLKHGLEAWGNAAGDDLVGDPLDGVMSSALGLSCESTAPVGACPLGEIMPMMPIGRPGSPWNTGPVSFRTIDGKLWSFQPGSSAQDVHVNLVAGPPGKGKSVLLNTTNLGLILSRQVSGGQSGRLPRIAIIDIGFSSSGLISLLQSGLPEDRQHEVLHVAMRMEERFAINPFDTQLGCRRPLDHEKGFLRNLIGLLVTPPGKDAALYDGIPSLVAIVIDELYRFFDEEAPKIYDRGVDPVVDAAIEKHDVTIPPNRPTWWEVVDALAARKLWRHAARAQRFAVPTLHDIAQVIKTPRVLDMFRQTSVSQTTEHIVEAFMRLIDGALRQYLVLTLPTQFEVSSARVVSLDLNDVAPRGNDAESQRQTAIMYMLARHVLVRDFFSGPDEIDSYPAAYRDFHYKRLTDIREDKKAIVYDEFHRTNGAGSRAVRDQVLDDIRVCRKYGVQITLASQLVEDFDEQMVKQATGIWILGAGEGIGVKEISKTFGLRPIEEYILSDRLTGPAPGGAPLFAIIATRHGRYRHLLYNTLGPIELWAFSTTPNDINLRRRLYDRIGPRMARLALAKRFPSGTCAKYVEQRLFAMRNSGALSLEAEGNIVDSIADELVEFAKALNYGEYAA